MTKAQQELRRQEVEAILAQAAEAGTRIKVRLGRRYFLGTLHALGTDEPGIRVVVPIKQAGVCVELYECFRRSTIAGAIKQGEIEWPTVAGGVWRKYTPSDLKPAKRKKSVKSARQAARHTADIC